MITKELLSTFESIVFNFEREKSSDKKKSRDTGTIYTPQKLAAFIVGNSFKYYLSNKFPREFDKKTNSFEIESLLNNKNLEFRSSLFQIIKDVKILDPACGSGRFLIEVAEVLMQFWRALNPDVKEFEAKKHILAKNVYGVDRDDPACFVSKLRLIIWLFSDITSEIGSNPSDLMNLEGVRSDAYDKFLDIMGESGIKLSIVCSDFLLEFETYNNNGFDIILGNPPYVENKKIKDLVYKQKLYEKYSSAFRLFDLSILFVEKSLELLKPKDSFLSFLMTNKFLSADYGARIRDILTNQTEIKEIDNLSLLHAFSRTATYPIIIFLTRNQPTEKSIFVIVNCDDINSLISRTSKNKSLVRQSLLKNFPAREIPVQGNPVLINYLYEHFKPFAKVIPDAKVIYRPFGFLQYSRFFDNIRDRKHSDADLLLLGTGNVGKYHIKFDKRIKIAKREIDKVKYFKYIPEFATIWKELSSEKLIYREIAKKMTWVYDPGLFANVTGLYFVRIPSFATEKLFCLLSIMNSDLLNVVFTTLYGTLQMSGGYMRYNGSFIKRMPLTLEFPIVLSKLGKILQFLVQLKYDNPPHNDFKIVENYNKFFKGLSNALVDLLFLHGYFTKKGLRFLFLEKLVNSYNEVPDVELSYFTHRFNLSKYITLESERIDDVLTKIKKFYMRLNHNDILEKEIELISNTVKEFR